MKRPLLPPYERLVEAFEAMPGIGKKSAHRLAYHAVTDEKFAAVKLAHALEEALRCVRRCERCHNLSEAELCSLCSDESRDRTTLCIVQSARDIFTIEEGGVYRGLYYVVESIEALDEGHLDKATEGIKEVIFAFAPSIATDTMILYIEEKLSCKEIHFSKIAQGVPTGVALENIDMLSLARAIQSRIKIS